MEGKSNPWGVSLNRLSFKDAASDRPQRPKTLTPRTADANKQNKQQRSKKRKLRRQLSLAKMQMSVLKAKLGLEQMKEETETEFEDKKENHTHNRSVSVSTENLFLTIESMSSFEHDIKEAIQKIDGLLSKTDTDTEAHTALMNENKQLKEEISQMKQKLKETKKTGQKTDQVLASKFNEKEELYSKYDKMNKFMPEDAVRNKMKMDGISIEEQNKYFSVSVKTEDKMRKYDKMRKFLPESALRNKMKMDNISLEEQDRYFEDTKSKSKSLKKYDKMKKFLPESALRNKMKMDGVSIEEQDRYFQKEGTEQKKKKDSGVVLAKYDRMRKLGMPGHAIENKMRLDGISEVAIKAWLNPSKKASESSKKERKKKAIKATDPRLSKYDRMKKLQFPDNAIINKMRLDGIEQSLIHKWEKQQRESEEDSESESESETDSDPNEADPLSLNLPVLAKYNRMKKMKMPTSAIVNKMKLDGIDSKLIAAFEHPQSAQKKQKQKRKGGLGGIFHKKKASIPAKEKIKPSVDMKRFHWQTVDYKHAKNSIWKTMNETGVTKQINIGEFESLFAIKKKDNKVLKKKEEKKQEKKDDSIKFVSAKRQYNVELLLKRLKFDGAVLCNDIIEMNEEKLSLEMLIKVSDMVPSDEEQMQAINCSNNHDAKTVARFQVVERFFYDLSSVWSLQERLKLWIFKIEFAEIIGHLMDKINLLNKGLTDIQGSESLYEVFKVILAFGNYMNGGRRNGQAYGFSLETLRMLSGTKGSDGQTTLLMYIFKHCKQSESIGLHIVSELENVASAVKIDIDSLEKKIVEIENELKKLPKRLKEFEKRTKKSKTDIYATSMQAWMKKGQTVLAELKRELSEMNERAKALADTYAYKMEKVNDFLSIFNDFIKDWNKAKIKHTKREEKRKKDALRARKKEEAQRKLQLKLSKRTTTRLQLAKKNILKDEAKVKTELALKEKLKKTMKAHVRKQTVMKQMFSDVLNQSDEDEDEEEEEQYKEYISSYNGDGNGNPNIVHFNPDEDLKHCSHNSRDIAPLTNVIVASEKKNGSKKQRKQRFQYRGKGGNTTESNASTDGLFQKRKAVPTANQFGNVWEMNFSPMSRMAYSNTKERKKNTNPKKKKVKYKSGHVRRETRLKKAFESMEKSDLKALEKKSSKKKISVASPKSKGNAMYSKYRNKNKTTSNVTQMEF